MLKFWKGLFTFVRPSILGFIGDVVGGVLGFESQKETNAANAQQAAAQIAAQDRWRRTAHQTQVHDMRKAGLNPILSATGGSGAATPAGAQARMENEVGAGVNAFSASAAARMNRATTKNINVDTKNRDYRGVIWEKELATARQVEQSAKTEFERTREAKATANIAQIEEEWANLLRAGRVGASLGSAAAGARALIGRTPLGRLIPGSSAKASAARIGPAIGKGTPLPAVKPAVKPKPKVSQPRNAKGQFQKR